MSDRPSPPPPPHGEPARPFDWAVDRGLGEEIALGVRARARARRRQRHAFTGVLVALVAMGLWWSLPREAPPAAEATGPRSTQVLAPQRTTLPDGTVVDAQASAILSTEFQPATREVALRAGEAFFAVARDPARPFIVRAGKVSVRALGTAFTVKHAPEGVTVLVTEGQVAVEVGDEANPQPAPVVLTVGHRLTIPTRAAPDLATLPADEIERALAWRIPRLSFSGATLAEVSAQFAEHGGVQIAFAEPSLAELRISGILRANNRDALFRLLANDHGIRAERRGESFVLHRQP